MAVIHRSSNQRVYLFYHNAIYLVCSDEIRTCDLAGVSFLLLIPMITTIISAYKLIAVIIIIYF